MEVLFEANRVGSSPLVGGHVGQRGQSGIVVGCDENQAKGYWFRGPQPGFPPANETGSCWPALKNKIHARGAR